MDHTLCNAGTIPDSRSDAVSVWRASTSAFAVNSLSLHSGPPMIFPARSVALHPLTFHLFGFRVHANDSGDEAAEAYRKGEKNSCMREMLVSTEKLVFHAGQEAAAMLKRQVPDHSHHY